MFHILFTYSSPGYTSETIGYLLQISFGYNIKKMDVIV